MAGNKLNIPNFLTIFRIVLTPLLVIFLMDKRFALAFGVFILAGITDGLDGLVARVMNQKTRIGAILDPLADKALLASSYITLAITGMVPNWLAVIVISRDMIIVFGVVVFFLFHSGIEIRPTAISKLTTMFQLLTIFVVLYSMVIGIQTDNILRALFAITAALTIASGMNYLYKGIIAFSVDQQNNHNDNRL